MDETPPRHKPEHLEPVLSYGQRLRVWETNYGRSSDWVLEHRGEPIALFTEIENVEMFWDSYRLIPLTQDEKVLSLLHNEDFWNKMEGCVWRNQEFGIVAPHAFPGGFELPVTGRVSMRGLYITIEPPSAWDQVILWMRKVRRESSNRHKSQEI